jgi:ferredoxin
MCCIYAASSFEIDEEAKAVFHQDGPGSLEEIRVAVDACPTGALALHVEDRPGND